LGSTPSQDIDFDLYEVITDGTRGSHLGTAQIADGDITDDQNHTATFSTPIYMEAGKYYWLRLNGSTDLGNPNYYGLLSSLDDIWGRKGRTRIGDITGVDAWDYQDTVWFRLYGNNKNVNYTHVAAKEDTYVRGDFGGNINYGTLTILAMLTNNDPGKAVAFEQYDLSAFAGRTIDSANLSLYFYNVVNTDADNNFTILLCDNSFDETLPTWNNYATHISNCETIPAASVTTNSITQNARYDFTGSAITDYVNSQVSSGDYNITVIYNYTDIADADDIELGTWSREYTTNTTQRNYMEILALPFTGRAAPVMQDASLETPPIYTNSTMEGWCHASDVNSDDVYYFFRWFRNDTLYDGYENLSYSLNGDPIGINWNGTHFFTIEYTSDACRAYDEDWNLVGTIFDATGQVNFPRDVEFNGTHYLVVDTATDRVHTWNSTGSFYMEYNPSITNPS
jgi:hypothetical protein